jgi:hypothetical protein
MSRFSFFGRFWQHSGHRAYGSSFDHFTITPNDRGELYAISWFDGVIGSR